jgi:threonylcarbamoyladenosine tRNA methylthiotransferase MtaB
MERNGLGRTEQFIPVRVAGAEAGDLLSVRISGLSDGGLAGDPLQAAA